MILKREMLYESYSFESILTKLILLFMWGFSKSMFYFTIKSNYITKKNLKLAVSLFKKINFYYEYFAICIRLNGKYN